MMVIAVKILLDIMVITWRYMMRLQENEVVVILCLCNSAMITRRELYRAAKHTSNL